MLEFAAFLCGLVVMALEMTGSRLLAPFLGSSVLVWTALIGVIMASLSAGYWLGGRAADRNPSAKRLAALILAAAFCVLAIGVFHIPMLNYISGMKLRPEFAAIAAAVLLFSPASVLLGMVSPYFVRVAMAARNVDINSAGTIIGRFSAISAVGSIAGTFLGGYVFISWIGSSLTIYMLASLLMAIAVIALLSTKMTFRRARVHYTIPFIGLATCLFFGGWQFWQEQVAEAAGIFKIDTRYEHIEIASGYGIDNRPLRLLSTPPKLTQSAMFIDNPTELVMSYTRHFALGWQLRPDAQRILMLGGAGFSVPKYLLHTRDNIKLDVVEIDPGMTDIARAHFALKDDARMNIYHEDARTYLNRFATQALAGEHAEGKYQIIMGDTFSSAYNIPFQLSTVECARKIYDSLEDDGVYMCNIISAVTGDKGLLLRGIRASFEEVFPSVHIFPLSYSLNGEVVQNIILLATKDKDLLPRSAELKARGASKLIKKEMSKEAAKELEIACAMLDNEWPIKTINDLPPLRDDFAPVELYAMPLIYAN